MATCILVLFLAVAAVAEGQEARPATSPSGSPSGAPPSPSPSPRPVEAARPVKGRLYLEGGYVRDLDTPGGLATDRWLYEQRPNAVVLEVLQFLIEQEPTLSHPVGFRLNVMGGEESQFIHALGLGNPATAFDLTEACLRFKAPLGRGLDIDVGKFVSPMGGESLYAIDNANYSRSYLFSLGEATTHTGLRLRYVFNERFDASLYAVNGWDTFRDNNGAKTLGLSMNWTPIDEASFIFTAFHGPEEAGNNASNRTMIDWVASLRPAKDWTFYLNFDYSAQQNVSGLGNVRWSGFSGVVRHQFTDHVALALRGEVFDDTNGFRTGIPQTLTEFTITPEFKMPLEGVDLLIRPEFRKNFSNVPSFNGGTRTSQTTFGIGVMVGYPFSFK